MGREERKVKRGEEKTEEGVVRSVQERTEKEGSVSGRLFERMTYPCRAMSQFAKSRTKVLDSVD